MAHYNYCNKNKLIPLTTGLIGKELQELNMENLSLGPKRINAIGKALSTHINYEDDNQKIKKINLAGNNINEESAVTIINSFPNNIEIINLKHNKIA
jgi:hypothetical protein